MAGLDPRIQSKKGISMAKKIEDAIASMAENLKIKTGKSVADWIKLAAKTKLAKHGEIVKFLKTEHGLTHGYANFVALSTLKSSSPDAGGDEDLVAAQYAGAKAAVIPIYDALVAAICKFGKDIEFSPKKAYVSLRRNKQFGIIQPSTAARVDVGINLKGTPSEGRLEASGSFNAMVSHRVRVGSVAKVDKELVGWLKKAYEAS